MDLCLGLKEPNPDDVQLKLGDFADFTKLPTPPLVFGHGLNLQWGLLGNSSCGDCVWAGAAHEEMAWHSEVGALPPFTAQSVVAEYSAVTGYVPGNPLTDGGTDMKVAADYRRKTGLKDAVGNRHTIEAYLKVDYHNIDHLIVGSYCFGATALCCAITFAAEQQFARGEPWTVVPFSPVKGLHYVPLVGRNSKNLPLIVTWGRLQAVTYDWLAHYLNMAMVYISPVPWKNGKTLEGFNRNDLNKILASL